MKLFQPSGIWRFRKEVSLPRLAVAAVLVCLSAEGVCRLAPHLVGDNVHQPLHAVTLPCHEACDQQRQDLRWRTNAHGARGELYHGEKTRIAVFGTSTSVDVSLDQPKAWSEVLVRQFPAGSVHVENFARDGASNNEMEILLRHMAELGRHYDVAILMDHWRRAPEPPSRKNTFHYSAQWYADSGLLHAPELIYERLNDQYLREPRLVAIKTALSGLWRNSTAQAAPVPVHPFALDTKNRILRNNGTVKLVDVPVEMSPNRKSFITERVSTLVGLAKRIATRVLVMSQPVAYDPHEVPGVGRRWFSLYPVSDNPPTYKSDKSVAEAIRQTNAVALPAARKAGADTLDLDALIRPYLRQRDDLFIDKWHFAPAGSRLAATFIARHLKGGPGA